jgi:predicted ATPase/DNA-binding CsgD family transcriptional regulator
MGPSDRFFLGVSVPTRLVGRERELIEVQLRLSRDDVRLLTLTGAGGSGKTRLAIEAASTLAESFRDGALFTDLSSLSHVAQVIPTIAVVLGISEGRDLSVFEQLQQVLAGGEYLLVLDNFEHVLAAAPQIAELLATCPGLKILATSRAALRVRWEHEFEVRPLALPETSQVADIDALARIPSVALFVERASAASPDFALSADNAGAVAQICQRLDGLPLALELAAARTRLLPPQELARRLQARLPTLSSGPRDLPARQQTLHASIDWSYQLLEPNERRAFQRVAVFVGGGHLAQVEAVCRESDQADTVVLDALAALVEHNLVRRGATPDDEVRLRMLETIREFALEELQASGEAEEIRRRHALMCVDMAETAGPQLYGAGRMPWVSRLLPDFDNFRTALEWLLTHGEADLSCRLAGSLTWWWYPLGRVRTGLDWAERALECAGACEVPARNKALFASGVLAVMCGDLSLARRRLDECTLRRQEAGDMAGLAQAQIHLGIVMAMEQPAHARALHEQALAVIRQLDDPQSTALAFLSSGDRAFAVGELAEARAHFEESLALFRQTGDSLMAAQALNKLGDLARGCDDYARAAALYAESLALMRRHEGDSGIPGVLHNLGYVAHHQGDYRRAFDHFLEAIVLFRVTGDQRGIAECLLGVAAVALARDRPQQAAQLFGAADAALDRAGMSITTSNASDYHRNIEALRARLGRVAFAEEWSAGRVMTADQAIAYANAFTEEQQQRWPGTDGPDTLGWLAPLTPREREVARLLLRNRSNREIASELVISEQTAETHAKRVLHKLGVSSRHQLRDWLEGADRQT